MGSPSLMSPVGPGTAAAGVLVEDLRELVRAREQQVSALWGALDAFSASDFAGALRAVVLLHHEPSMRCGLKR